MPNDANFCYWQVRTEIDYYVGCVLFIISYGLLLKITYELFSIFLIRDKVEKRVKQIYVILFCWALSQCSKLLFGQILYLTTIQDGPSDNTMNNISRYFCAIDSISTFFLQWNLLLIPYTWCTNVVRRLNHLSVQKKKTKYVLAFVHVYMFARIFIHFLLTLFEVMADGATLNKNLCIILNVFVILDAFFCMLVLLFGLFTLFSNFKQLKLNDERDRKKLLGQFFLMIAVCLIRFIVDIIFLVVPNELILSTNCVGAQNLINQLIFTVIYFAGGIILTHIFPVMLILRIYSLKKNQTVILSGSSMTDSSGAYV